MSDPDLINTIVQLPNQAADQLAATLSGTVSRHAAQSLWYWYGAINVLLYCF